MTLTTEQLSAVETTKEFRALLKYMRAIAKAEPESVKEKFELEEGLWRYASQKTIKAIVGHIDALEFALVANREAQPVMWVMSDDLTDEKIISTPAYPNRVEAEERMIGELTPLYTALPAPAVPGIDELRLTFERSERESDDGFNLHKYGIGYADEATQARWESWLSCRAAMLKGERP